MQEAYLSEFSNLAKFRAEASLATWLTRIVVTKAINRLPREDVVVPLEAVEYLERPEGDIVGMPHLAFELDPETAAARSQVRDLLERAIDNLPEPFRVVFVMRLVEQLSVKETASSLGPHRYLSIPGPAVCGIHRCAVGSVGREYRSRQQR